MSGQQHAPVPETTPLPPAPETSPGWGVGWGAPTPGPTNAAPAASPCAVDPRSAGAIFSDDRPSDDRPPEPATEPAGWAQSQPGTRGRRRGRGLGRAAVGRKSSWLGSRRQALDHKARPGCGRRGDGSGGGCRSHRVRTGQQRCCRWRNGRRCPGRPGRGRHTGRFEPGRYAGRPAAGRRVAGRPRRHAGPGQRNGARAWRRLRYQRTRRHGQRRFFGGPFGVRHRAERGRMSPRWPSSVRFPRSPPVRSR